MFKKWIKITLFLFFSILGRLGSCNYCMTQIQNNIDDQPLSVCSTDPMTGWYRNGKCMTDSADRGTHVVCAVMTDKFLDYTKSKGNDLSTQRGSFPGLKAGDRWCLCAIRWREAHEDDKAPLVDASATHRKVLESVKEDVLRLYVIPS